MKLLAFRRDGAEHLGALAGDGHTFVPLAAAGVRAHA
jgi:hypothetical protein